MCEMNVTAVSYSQHSRLLALACALAGIGAAPPQLTASETVLHSFTGGDDGGSPYTGVILGPDEQLFGATALGGQANVGVVFAIKL